METWPPWAQRLGSSGCQWTHRGRPLFLREEGALALCQRQFLLEAVTMCRFREPSTLNCKACFLQGRDYTVMEKGRYYSGAVRHRPRPHRTLEHARVFHARPEWAAVTPPPLCSESSACVPPPLRTGRGDWCCLCPHPQPRRTAPQ